MPKYTYKDIIIDPASEEAKNCIGKVVYYSDNPTECLYYANKNNTVYCGTLKEINTSIHSPFVSGINADAWGCIIPKKEELSTEYVPFKNISEFIGAYRKVEAIQLKKENFYLSIRGIWLKDKMTDVYCMVTEIWNEGIAVFDKKPTINGMSVYNNSTTWEGLLEDYTFIDGSPCGKIKGISNE